MSNSNKANKTNILYMSITEREIMNKAGEQLEIINNKMKQLSDERHELLNLIHIARTYYKYKGQRAHPPTPDELDDFYEIKGDK
jgi:carbonic anhydrase